MKSLPVFLVTGILIFGSFVAMPEKNRLEKDIYIKVPEIHIERERKYAVVKIKDASFDYSPGKPILPIITKVIELPFGVRVKKIKINVENVVKQKLNAKIKPSIGPLPLIPWNPYWNSYKIAMDNSVYKSNDFYPSSWYNYKVGCGLNENGNHVTFVSIHFYPVRYAPLSNEIEVVKEAKIKIEYTHPEKRLPSSSIYKMVIISPPEFKDEAERLAEHKNNIGFPTFVKITDDIYKEYSGRDEPEKIKYFIKDAIEQYGIKYVLLFGGLKSTIWGKARDNANAGIKGWYVPVRYTNLFDNPKYPLGEVLHDPGFASDLYYADIYKEGGEFEDWDPNHDGIFAAWNRPGVANDSMLDLYPDVYVGRLACRSIKEAKTVVDKIIKYENGCGNWFKRMVIVSGDGFLDQQDLNIKWDTKSLPDGDYTIYAQSINRYGKKGPIDVTHVKVNHNAKTKLTFNHDDYLIPALQNSYPAPPIAKIVSVSNGDVLGKDDYHYTPGEREAYCNEFFHWANISYENGVLTIRGKSYDPEPYGNVTSIHVWINDSNGNVVFEAWRNNTEMYYEGEWTTGEKPLMGRGGALYYMPDDFEKVILWGSNGKFTGQNDVLNALNNGCGFLFMSGHGSPNVWADHLPGIPGNRQHSSLLGLQVTSLKPWFPYFGFPLFPADSLKNGEKLPVAVLGGCHNSQFNVSVIPAFLNIFSLIFPSFNNYMWTYGQPVPECLSWRLVRNPHGGSIASIGNTGLGYGMPGRACTTGGGDSWITIEFFKQYGSGHKILGDTYEMAITEYINSFDMSDMEAGHVKTVEQWELLGDPSLMIGGYT